MKNLSLFAISVVLSLVVAEGLLRVFTPFPINATSNLVPHDELLYVTDPDYPGMDEKGFRNKAGPEGASVFAIGDSHTFGFGVPYDQSWPEVLGRRTGLKVYNMSVPSYNFYQYFRLFEMALRYSPKYVVVGIYAANDLAAAACRTLNLPYWQGRAGELGLGTEHCSATGQSAAMAELVAKESIRESLAGRLKAFLKTNVALVSAFDRLVWDRIQQDSPPPAAADASGETALSDWDELVVSRAHPEVNFKRRRAVVEGNYVDLRDVTIRGNFENSKILMRRMKQLADANGVELLVLFIASKRRVVARWAHAQGLAPPPLLDEIAANEDALIQRYIDLNAELAVPTVDATDRLVAALERNFEQGIVTYQAFDGHPTGAGQLEYAETILPQVRRAELAAHGE